MPSRTNFQDVGDFHEKFDLPNVTHRGPGPNTSQVTPALLVFRMLFMLEELKEFAEACGYELTIQYGNSHDQLGCFVFAPIKKTPIDETELIQKIELPSVNDIDHEKAFDALLDLAYVVLGSAQVMGYPWQEGWDEVQQANITKERCGIDHTFLSCFHGFGLCTSNPNECHYIHPHSDEGAICGEPRNKHSLRGSSNDVIKPTGWMPPRLTEILKRYGFGTR